MVLIDIPRGLRQSQRLDEEAEGDTNGDDPSITCHMPQFAKKQFNVIEEHCVTFYAKFVIDDQVWSRIINVIQNILFINK